MLISIDRNSSTPVYLQITNQIREMIISGALPPGFRLLPERKLADILDINRSTVLNAYRELKADGLIDSRVGQGTIVLPYEEKKVRETEEFINPLPWRQFYSQSALRTREPLLRDLMEIASREDVISFAAGIAALELDPVNSLKEIQEELLKKRGRIILQHTPTEGCYPLREGIAGLMESRGIYAPPEDILVLSGSQQGIEIAAKVFLDPGDIVIVEEPSFFSALQIFEAAGARLIGVPTDKNGMRIEVLEMLLSRYKPKMIYTMPTFQNPSGVTMDNERRRKLIELAYRYQIPVLEDDPYGELRYEGNPLPPLKALDNYGYVIYLSTFSKILFPGLRVGWMTAPRQVIKQFALVKQMADLHANSISQWLIESFLSKGLLKKHVKEIRGEYCRRRDVMLEALEEYAPQGVEWNVPEGGFYLWCSLPESVVQSRLLVKAAERKVAFVTGDAFYMEGQGQNFIRLSFTFNQAAQIKEGIKRLMDAIREIISENSSSDNSKRIEIKPIF